MTGARNVRGVWQVPRNWQVPRVRNVRGVWQVPRI